MNIWKWSSDVKFENGHGNFKPWFFHDYKGRGVAKNLNDDKVVSKSNLNLDVCHDLRPSWL